MSERKRSRGHKMSSPYDKRLDSNTRAIRIFTLLPGRWSSSIHCLLLSVTLDDNATYETISYAWGDPDDRETILIENVKIEIPRSLEAALRHLRQPTKAIQLWADAICINQQDREEKAHQISMMGDIFRRCKSTYIWLGTPSTFCPTIPCSEEHELIKNHEEATRYQVDPFFLIHHFARDGHLYELPCFARHGPEQEIAFLNHHGFKIIWRAFMDCLQKPWWSRFWCVQECLLSNSALVILGHWKVPWQTVKVCEINYKRHLLGCCSDASNLMPQEYTFYPDLVVVSTRLDLNRSTDPLPMSGDLDQLLRSFGHKACRDPRDKIYGIWGLTDQSRYPGFTIDYSMRVASVYINVMGVLLQDAGGDLRCLTGLGFNSQVHDLPSWARNFDLCPDIEAISYELMRFQSYELFNAAKGVKATPNIAGRSLSLQGLFIDKVHRVGKAIQQRSWQHVWNVFQDWLVLVGLENAETTWGDYLGRIPGRAFCYTLVGEVLFDSHEPPRRINDEDMESFTSWLSDVLQAIQQEHAPPMSPWMRTLFSAVHGRALFCTEQGHIGLCHPLTRPGDDLWIVHGGKVPFVLRQSQEFRQRTTESQHHSLIGEAYLHRFMDGEALSHPYFASQARRLILR